MGLKLILLSAVLLFVPPALWLLTRRKTSRPLLLLLGLLIIWLGGLMIVYPLGSFSWALLKVGPVFDSNCPTAIQLSRRYMTIPYFQVQINLIGAVTGHTPRYYYLNVIGLCEKKMGNIRESVKTFEELQTYTARSPYDNDEIEATKNILNRLQWKIKESNAQN